MTKNLKKLPVASALIASLIVLSGCGQIPFVDSGSLFGGSGGEATGDASAEGIAKGMSQLEDTVLVNSAPKLPEAIATMSGAHGKDDDKKHNLIVDIYEVTVREDNTFMSWSVRDNGGGDETYSIVSDWCEHSTFDKDQPFKAKDTGVDSASYVSLVMPDSEIALWPLQRPIGYEGMEKNRVGCLCSGPPEYLTKEPHVMNGLYPKIPEGVDKVTIDIPNFPLIKDVPVSREG